MASCFSYHDLGYGYPSLSLSHKRHYNDSDVFIDALSFVFRNNPTISSLEIKTTSVFSNVSISWDHLCSLKYLSWLDLEEFQIHDPNYFSIAGCFETLTIPKNTKTLVLPEDCSSMHCIRLFSQSMVSFVAFDVYNPIIVPPDFRILVQSSLVNTYFRENWCHVRFVSSVDQAEVIPGIKGLLNS